MEKAVINLELFSATRKAIKDFASDIAKLNKIPHETRVKYIDVVDETMTLLDSALMLAFAKLGALLQEKNKKKFVEKLENIDYFDEWLDMERKISLCINLKKSVSEMYTILARLAKKISLHHKKAFDESLLAIFQTEQYLAGAISDSFNNLAYIARTAKIPDDLDVLKEKTRQARDLLRKERNELIQDQIEINNYIVS